MYPFWGKNSKKWDIIGQITYFLNTNHVNDDFIVMLSRKSGVEKDQVDSLYRSIVATQATPAVSDYQLLTLQDQIQQFYKNTGKKY